MTHPLPYIKNEIHWWNSKLSEELTEYLYNIGPIKKKTQQNLASRLATTVNKLFCKEKYHQNVLLTNLTHLSDLFNTLYVYRLKFAIVNKVIIITRSRRKTTTTIIEDLKRSQNWLRINENFSYWCLKLPTRKLAMNLIV